MSSLQYPSAEQIQMYDKLNFWYFGFVMTHSFLVLWRLTDRTFKYLFRVAKARGWLLCDDHVLCDDVRERRAGQWPVSEQIPWAVTDREMFSSGLTLTQWTWRYRRTRWSRCQSSRRSGGSRRRSTRWRRRTASFTGGRCGGRLQKPHSPERWQVLSQRKVCWEVTIRKLKDTKESHIVMLSQFLAAVKV